MSLINKEELENLINDKNTLKEIALILKVSYNSVKRYCKKFNLKSIAYDYEKKIINCKHCNKEVEDYKEGGRKFCNRSCSASCTNQVTKRKHDIKKCLICENIIKHRLQNAKFCNRECHLVYKQQLIDKKIEDGESSSTLIKKYLIKKYGNKCMECDWNKINPATNKVPVELEHIDGNSENNKLDNVKLLCPNCHSLTPTYKALNKGNGRHNRMKRYKDKKSY